MLQRMFLNTEKRTSLVEIGLPKWLNDLITLPKIDQNSCHKVKNTKCKKMFVNSDCKLIFNTLYFIFA